jgi:alkanesulfonate monooxygenase
MTPQPKPTFGVWALTPGAWGSKYHPQEPVDPSWERNRAQVLEAERLGYDATLLAQHTFSPGDAKGPLEAWSASAALAALTERIEIISAIKPFLYHPVVLAKMALQIEEISGGRFAINLVAAFLKPELLRAGLPFLEHDERYAYAREWLEVFARLTSDETVTFNGRWFSLDGYRVVPKDRFRSRPRIYMGGESVPARELAADLADVWFLNGQSVEYAAELVADASARRDGGAPLRFGMAAFVITRETEQDLQAAVTYAQELDRRDQEDYEKFLTNVDEKSVMFQRFRQQRHIGTNGGTAAGLVGTYDEVAERIIEFNRVGIGLFMLQFQPTEPEMARFAQEVIPRVRELSRAAAVSA